MKQKQKNNQLKLIVSIFLFTIFNSLNALTVINFIPGICQITGLSCQVNDLIIFGSPEEITPSNTKANQPADNSLPTFIQNLIPALPKQITDNFIPNLSTITESTTQMSLSFMKSKPNSFISYLQSKPTTGGSRSPESPYTPPPVVITDCTPTQTITQNITLSCYKGRRNYNTQLLTIENPDTTKSCTFELSLDDSAGPPIINNLTTGNADIFFTVSTVENTTIDLNLLPAPEKIGTWTQWNNNPLQIELVGSSILTPTTTQDFIIPQNSSRNLGVIIDCGLDTITSETATIKLKSTFKD